MKTKKLKKFLNWKISQEKNNFVFTLVFVPILLLTIGILALPGVIITFLLDCNTSDIVAGGILSIFVVGFTIILVSKTKKLVEESNEFECETSTKE